MLKPMLFGAMILSGILLECLPSFAAAPVKDENMVWLQEPSFDMAAVPQFQIIVPGVSVGAVKIGSKPTANLFPGLGKPQVFRNPDGPSSHGWKCSEEDCGVIVKTSGSGANEVVTTIYITVKNVFRTQAGIGIGSPVQQVKNAYPSGKQIDGMDSDYCWSISGANFCFYQGIVSSIAVFNPLIGET